MTRILIIGATSAIALATARRYAAQGASLFLVARNADRLSEITQDLAVRGAKSCDYAVLDFDDIDVYPALINSYCEKLGGLDIALIAHGSLSDQRRSEQDLSYLLQEIQINATSVIALSSLIGQRLSDQGHGTLAVIGSVAGDRGRQSNYLYGSCKGFIALFLQGLRNHLHKRGVQVLTIKPGFVDTPMTAAFKKGALWATPEQIAACIEQAITKRKDIVYLPGFWAFIMLVIKHVPEVVFKRLSL